MRFHYCLTVDVQPAIEFSSKLTDEINICDSIGFKLYWPQTIVLVPFRTKAINIIWSALNRLYKKMNLWNKKKTN